MPKKRHFKYRTHSTLSHDPTITSSTALTTSDISRHIDSNPTAAGGVTAHLQSLRDSARARPNRQAVNDYVESSTSPSLPPEITRSLNAHNGQSSSNISRFYGTRALRTWENGQEIIFHNMARPGRRPVWTRANFDSPLDGYIDKCQSFSKGFSKLAFSTTGSNALPERGSLADTCLKTLARNWTLHREYDSLNLDWLPVHLKSKLVTYIGIYCGDSGSEKGTKATEDGMVTLADLRTLFSTETDLQDVHMLDFTGCISDKLTFKDIIDWLSNQGNIRRKADEIKITTTQNKRQIQDLPWDQQLAIATKKMASTNPYGRIPTSLIIAPFENLTHLSLAYPGSSYLWSQLYDFTRKRLDVFRRLTHLSLAHWESPFGALGTDSDKIRSLILKLAVGFGDDTQLVNEWWPCPELVTLAKATPRLKELDLEGCAGWALIMVESNEGDVTGNDAAEARTFPPFAFYAWDELEVIHMGQNCYPKNIPKASGPFNGLHEIASFYHTAKPEMLVNQRGIHQAEFITDEAECAKWWRLEEKMWNASKELIKGRPKDRRKGIVLNGSYPKTFDL
jgi:hypothetical protein